MASRKPSAKARKQAEFESGFLVGSDAFEREERWQVERHVQREVNLRNRACDSKNRYSSLGEAEEAISLCEEHGTYGLRVYKCSYCNGWHLTSKDY